jgi:hypothetical protein
MTACAEIEQSKEPRRHLGGVESPIGDKKFGDPDVREVRRGPPFDLRETHARAPYCTAGYRTHPGSAVHL